MYDNGGKGKNVYLLNTGFVFIGFFKKKKTPTKNENS